MKRALRKTLATTLCFGLLAPSALAQRKAVSIQTARKNGSSPKLVVVIVVDQMRGDYIERYGHQWTKGLRRLVQQGAWFRQAAYTYMNTITCAGHSTIGTGTFPTTHGMILNEWWDRELGKQVSCTEDANAKTVSYGSPEARAQYSGWRLQATTLADELRAQLSGRPRVITVSLKARSAIGLAGHGGDAVTWFHDASGAWVTSSAYAEAPVAAVEKFVKANPVDAYLGKKWRRALPESEYLFPDDAEGERPPRGWTRAFPHQLKGLADKADAHFYDVWKQTPYSDAYLGKMAATLADEFGLGKDETPDFLGISFSALDLTGHDFGPRSHEVQDVLIGLDATIGKLLSHLDKTVGAANYVVGLTADHGVAPIPEQATREGLEAGRIALDELAARIEKAIEAFFGPGKHVVRMRYTEIYFAPGIYEQLKAEPKAMRAVMEAIAETPGIARVFRGDEMTAQRNSGDTMTRATALSYFAGRSGDLVMVPKPYWLLVSTSRDLATGDATTHGTWYAYDARVPLILMGLGIQRGSYLGAASPADIAPTLAFLCGITLPRVDGRVLAEALRLPQATSAAANVKKQ